MEVLGVNYDLIHDADLIKSGCDGECQIYSKIIRIRPKEQMLDDFDSDEEKEKRYNEVCRHELIHAMFVESGLCCYSNDEILVDWIASQFPKIAELFKSMNCSE